MGIHKTLTDSLKIAGLQCITNLSTTNAVEYNTEGCSSVAKLNKKIFGWVKRIVIKQWININNNIYPYESLKGAFYRSKIC